MRWKPEPPTEVVIIHADGSKTPAQVRYQGKEDGVRMWLVVDENGDPLEFDPATEHLTIKKMPARSGITFKVTEDSSFLDTGPQ